jgi:hypothetical protein
MADKPIKAASVTVRLEILSIFYSFKAVRRFCHRVFAWRDTVILLPELYRATIAPRSRKRSITIAVTNRPIKQNSTIAITLESLTVATNQESKDAF